MAGSASLYRPLSYSPKMSHEPLRRVCVCVCYVMLQMPSSGRGNMVGEATHGLQMTGKYLLKK